MIISLGVVFSENEVIDVVLSVECCFVGCDLYVLVFFCLFVVFEYYQEIVGCLMKSNAAFVDGTGYLK